MNIRKYFEPKNSEPGILTGTDGDKNIRKKITAQEDRKEEELSSEEVKKMKKKIEELSHMKKTFSVFPPSGEFRRGEEDISLQPEGQ